MLISISSDICLTVYLSVCFILHSSFQSFLFLFLHTLSYHVLFYFVGSLFFFVLSFSISFCLTSTLTPPAFFVSFSVWHSLFQIDRYLSSLFDWSQMFWCKHPLEMHSQMSERMINEVKFYFKCKTKCEWLKSNCLVNTSICLIVKIIKMDSFVPN